MLATFSRRYRPDDREHVTTKKNVQRKFCYVVLPIAHVAEGVAESAKQTRHSGAFAKGKS